jgi:hypothetical protein
MPKKRLSRVQGVVNMDWIPGFDRDQRRARAGRVPRTVEVLETRALLADGISAMPGPAISAVAGTEITNAILASFTVTDPSGDPGSQWRALVNFGDGQSDGPIVPVQKGGTFEFIDTHTYTAPGAYTITVMIALPGSHKPNDNTVTTHATVISSTPPPPSPLAGSGVSSRVRLNKTFHGSVARFSERHTKAQEFTALIDWGDQLAPDPGLIRARGRGRFVVVGSHHYGMRGAYNVAVTIQDGSGQQIVTHGLVRVVS